MAEKFTSYRAKSTNASGTIVVVPKSGSTNTIGDERTANSTAQIHSFYVTQALPNHIEENPNNPTQNPFDDNMNYFHIGISDDINTLYIGHDIPLVPQSAYYIEKTITLLPSQYIFVEFPTGAGKNGNAGYEVDVVASVVDLT